MTTSHEPLAWEALGASPTRGFLPTEDPCVELPLRYGVLHELAADLPKRLLAGRLRSAVDALPVLDMSTLARDGDRRCAMRVLSYLAHAYVWGSAEPATRLPAGIARPWCQVAQALGRPPVLSYASYALDNWRRIDRDGPVATDNIEILQNFLGGADEDWFIAIHVEIEALAAPILVSLEPAWEAVGKSDEAGLLTSLERVAGALEQIVATLNRMPEHCDPYIYYRRVRPFIHGWKGQPALPSGLVYAGVPAYSESPQQFRGETGAQSSIVPLLDALLGIAHESDPLRVYLDEMRNYMPPGHRRLLAAVEARPSLREAVAAGSPELREAYDACVAWLDSFRETHLDYAGRYIHSQAQAGAANPTDVGTGGTPFMRYLAKHRNETAEHKLGE
jgi:indoleamine 2,3-dioxygenase